MKRFLSPSCFCFFCIFVTLKRFRSSNNFYYYTKITRVNTKWIKYKNIKKLLREKSCPNLPGPTWKCNCPLNLITGCATLGSNNCNLAFAITFTFMHLADAFIQSDLHCIQVTVFTFLSALAFPGNRTHDLGVASPMLYHLSYRKAGNESFTSLWRNCGPFFFAELF